MRRVAPSLALLVALAACGGGQEAAALIASSNGAVGVGEQRLLVGLIDRETQESLAAPDRGAAITLRDENGAPLGTYPGEFIWTVPEVRGLYVARVEIPEAGTYQITVDAEGYATAAPVGLIAFEDSPLVQPGEPAPPSQTRTSAESPDLSSITTDPEPDPEMYRMTVAEAVSNGTPAVIVFATPAFCVSQTCGPLLDQVKALRTEFPEVDFVHVEIYQDLQVDSPEELTVVPAVEEWGLPSEPWVFVVGSDGVVAAAFEGAVSDAELEEAIFSVAP